MELKTIFEIGAFVVVFAGVAGGFYSGYQNRKSSDNKDASDTIQLKDQAITALRTEVAELKQTVQTYDKRIKDLEADKAAYLKLFQGNPSQLESYMKETAKSMNDLAAAMATVLSLVQTHQPSTIINNK